MKTGIATDKSQSARLLRCGVPAESADMHISNYDELWAAPYKDNQRKDEEGFAPAWSLSALLGLLPKEMGIAAGAYPGCDKYTCFTLIDPDIEPIVADTAIESTVQMIEQLTNNGYILNEQ